jgi:DNA-binding response OmpR family regulator
VLPENSDEALLFAVSSRMKKRILVVDENQAVRDSLKKTLEGASYEVLVAAGGLEAAIRFEQGRVDLAVLDLNLPNQSGWEVCERLMTRYALVPVIIITGLPHQERAAKAARVGALFEKPIDVMALLKRVEELLAEPDGVRLARLFGDVEDFRHVKAKEGPAAAAPGTQQSVVADRSGERSRGGRS